MFKPSTNRFEIYPKTPCPDEKQCLENFQLLCEQLLLKKSLFKWFIGVYLLNIVLTVLLLIKNVENLDNQLVLIHFTWSTLALGFVQYALVSFNWLIKDLTGYVLNDDKQEAQMLKNFIRDNGDHALVKELAMAWNKREKVAHFSSKFELAVSRVNHLK